MNTFISYFKGVLEETKKVSWPERKDVINHTIIVLVSAGVAVAVTASVDFGLSRLIQFIIQSKS